MQLVPRGPSFVEVLAVRLADGLLVAGQRLHARFAVPAPGQTSDELVHLAARWRSHVQAFVTWGDPLRFSQRKMIRAGIVSRPAWDVYTKLLGQAGAGVLVVYKNSGICWAYGWERRKFNALLRRGLISVPHPTDDEPPAIFPPTSVAHNARLTQSARVSVFASEVVDQAGRLVKAEPPSGVERRDK
jgi:hypothetical protein